MKRFHTRVFVLLLALVLAIMPNVWAAEPSFEDMPDDWFQPALEAAVDNGLLVGDGQGRINAHRALTRAELAAILVRAYGAAGPADLSSYADVQPDAWYYDSLAQAVRMGVLTGAGALMEPNRPVTRQEAFTALARALSLEDGTMEDLDAFEDGADVAPWAVGPVAAMVKAGYVGGDGGRLEPAGTITRAQFAQVMDNTFAFYIREPGVVTEIPEGNVIINVDGVTLKDVTVTGDLIIGDGVGEGEAILDGVTVEGDTLVRGGGENTVILRQCSVQKITVKKKVPITNNSIKPLHIKLEAGVKVEKKIVAEEGNVNIEVADPAIIVPLITANAPVEVWGEGNVTQINVPKNVSVTVKVNVETVLVSKEGSGAKIVVPLGGKVEKVEGEGKDNVTITDEDGNEYKPEPPATPVPSIPDEPYVPPVTTDPPATDPPATDPPATDPPATDPPATDPPATDPPATDPPVTDPPATDPPASDPPATEDAD